MLDILMSRSIKSTLMKPMKVSLKKNKIVYVHCFLSIQN